MNQDELEWKVFREDMALIKNILARRVTIEDAPTIARNIGLRRTKTLTTDAICDLAYLVDTPDVSRNERLDFCRADLIMEATDGAGEPRYVAVEVSFTATCGDINRALRNAALLTKWTGRPAHAVVSGIYRDDRIRRRITSEDVSWHQLDAEALEVE